MYHKIDDSTAEKYFAHCTTHFNMLFPCSSAIIPVTVWFFYSYLVRNS